MSATRPGGVAWLSCLLLVPLFVAGSGVEGKGGSSDPQEEKVAMAIKVKSSAFEEGQPIPVRHTGDGADVSPPLTWEGVPAGARSLALIMDDPDAPRPEPWVHWVLWGLPGDRTGLPEGVARAERVEALAGALQGKNSWGGAGYQGPAPPKGHGVHRYFFRLYALDAAPKLPPGATKEQVLGAIRGHTLAEGVLMGTYKR